MDRDRIVLGLGALAALQVLHLIDELRTDETAGLADVLLRPQPILGIGGTIAALVAVRRGSRFGRPLALTAAGLVALGFVLSHGVPGGSEPYWGDGSADVLQWLGVTLILVCCAALAVLLLRPKEAA
jgi:peptidoglycan/LPS O-acetylase OafA/YrhL